MYRPTYSSTAERSTTVTPTKLSTHPRCITAVQQMTYSSSTGRERAVKPWVVKALVRWATGKRLTNRLPKLSLITLSPPLNSGILGVCMRPYVPTPKFFTISGNPGRVIYQILDMRKCTFFKTRFHGGREIRTHDQRTMVVCRRRHL